MKAFRMDNRGAALVEFAIVAVLLFTLVFGIIEFGMLIKDFLALNQASREGVRTAALRGDHAEVVDRVKTSATSLGLKTDSTTMPVIRPDYRVYDYNTSTWGAWVQDDVPPDSILNQNVQVRVHAEYKHKLVTGAFFAWMTPGGTGDSLTIHSDMVMKRE